jgi:hypothetical protein
MGFVEVIHHIGYLKRDGVIGEIIQKSVSDLILNTITDRLGAYPPCQQRNNGKNVVFSHKL